ncbi:hypothetical protein ACRAWB_18280 [Leifsonia poae]|uniref:hypothetical protein n=1 Tax=Leifsonia poae TaxID=110933 RepID=UPI003D688AEB
MGGIDNLDDVYYELRRMKTEIHTLGAANPLASSSLTHGRLRIGGDAILLVDSSGGLVVHGSINGDGTITWSGVFELTGTTRFKGDTTQIGALHVQGPVDATGSFDISGALRVLGTAEISGAATLKSNLTVTTGRIIVGNMVLNPALTGSGAVGALTAPTALLLSAPGVFTSDQLTVATDLFVNGQIHNLNIPSTTSAANVYVDTLGILRRVSSAARFKDDVAELAVPDALLDVRVKDWVDKPAVDGVAELQQAPRPFTQRQQAEFDALTAQTARRVPGVIAEDVAAAGGQEFLAYDGAGEIEGVAYDRLALARTQLLADRLSVALDRIDELERRLEELQS